VGYGQHQNSGDVFCDVFVGGLASVCEFFPVG